ncbi:hypothetical protein SAMN05518849_101556 [Sphingobium sp. AP50]|uniref:hypothetical protein n=1 Tax=Sphingobium sp. AP50 TaxID=1884369 RepID=UPI0008B8A3FC|nr:hypothetical protein [Sphingobium sp. AP50]SEI68657.1 hypothetical protein SAMN05518849_101556 [Sphingobium sp. AP50]
MLRYLLMLAACLLAIPLAACESVADQCAKAANPAECAKVASAGGNVNDYLLYGMAGYMLSSAMNGGQRQTVIVPDPHYRGYRRPIPSYQASRDYVRSRTVTTTTTKRSLFGGTKTTTSNTRFSYRPSYRRSSFSSYRRR